MSLDERKARILQAIIDDYILTAVPVGSRTISRKSGMGLSSATIRNEMSDLEELGLLDQPHTSAGRIPSWRAYRLYVDQLMRVVGLPSPESVKMQGMFSRRMNQMEAFIESAARTLSDMTDYPAVVMAAQSAKPHYKRVQFVRINDERALMVVVLEGGATQESLVSIPKDWPDDHLYMISQMMSERISGRTAQDLKAVAQSLGNEIKGQGAVFSQLMDAIKEGSDMSAKPGLALGGSSKLLRYPEYADIDKAREVLSTLETTDKLAKLLTTRSAMEFSVSIGPELAVEGMEECSLVTVSYRLQGDRTGTLGVIGPTRMHYARVVSVLDAMRWAIQNVFHEEG